MRVISAYLLAVLGGNDSPSAKDINNILSSVGVEADSERVDALLKEVEGKDINEVIAEGLGKLASVPSGGGGGGGGSGAAAASGGDGGAAAKEEEKKEEEAEESDEDMGFSLFD
ncbi:hypothetical protein WJX72_002531 [[Myrmecia] bisecta]|uniref:60S acidic ribosomal protein P2 n=1 Tax=[Myrmecia] bisecta TaxID=41462 RepID=A0AAW1R5V6_9CHLO